MRIVFCGTPEVAVPPLLALADAGHDIVFVITQPDRRRARGSASWPSPVRVAAEARGLAVRTPTRASNLVDEVGASDADLGVVVAFGQLLPQALLDAVPQGFVNLHFSLLPRWRGAAPVQRAILEGDERTGVCVMRLEAGLDTGPVFAEVATPIGPDETAGDLTERLVEIGTALLLDTLVGIEEREPVPQAGEATYAAKLSVEEFRIDPRRGARELARLVRAGSPRPGAWALFDGQRVKVLRARAVEGEGELGCVDDRGRLSTGDGLLEFEEVQPEGKAPMAARSWRAGRRGKCLRLEVA
jgi:methionyl-tRNA formyltransferase